MTDFDKAMRDPKTCFDEPQDLLNDDSLSKEQKIKLLQQWEYDARQLSVAEEENMPSQTGEESNMLNRIQRALRELGVECDEGLDTKQ